MRDLKLDNIRGFLITLVILGHLIQVFTTMERNAFGYLYDIIYSFHMPLFIMASGFLFKKAGAIRRALSILVIYILFQCLMMLPIWIKLGVTFDNVAFPAFSMWFLLSLACWNLMYYFVGDVKWLLAISIIISLVVGFLQVNGYAFSYMRTLSFFPFFVFGAKYLNKLNNDIRFSRSAMGLLAVSLLAVYSLYVHFSEPDYRVAHLIMSYNLNIANGLTDLARRAIYILFATSISYVMFVAFSGARSALSDLGKHTLPIYLSQACVLMYAPFIIKWRADEFSLLILFSFILISVVMAFLTGRKALDDLLRRISGSFVRLFSN